MSKGIKGAKAPKEIFVNEIYTNRWLELGELKDVTEIYLKMYLGDIVSINAKTEEYRIIGRDYNLYSFTMAYHDDILKGLKSRVDKLEVRIIFSHSDTTRRNCNRIIQNYKNCIKSVMELVESMKQENEDEEY